LKIIEEKINQNKEREKLGRVHVLSTDTGAYMRVVKTPAGEYP